MARVTWRKKIIESTGIPEGCMSNLSLKFPNWSWLSCSDVPAFIHEYRHYIVKMQLKHKHLLQLKLFQLHYFGFTWEHVWSTGVVEAFRNKCFTNDVSRRENNAWLDAWRRRDVIESWSAELYVTYNYLALPRWIVKTSPNLFLHFMKFWFIFCTVERSKNN